MGSILVQIFTLNVLENYKKEPTGKYRDHTKKLKLFFGFMPFLIMSAFFKIGSLIVIITYLNQLAIIPVIILLIFHIIMNEYILHEYNGQVPKWMMSFAALFVPICSATNMKIKETGKNLYFISLI